MEQRILIFWYNLWFIRNISISTFFYKLLHILWGFNLHFMALFLVCYERGSLTLYMSLKQLLASWFRLQIKFQCFLWSATNIWEADFDYIGSLATREVCFYIKLFLFDYNGSLATRILQGGQVSRYHVNDAGILYFIRKMEMRPRCCRVNCEHKSRLKIAESFVI